MEIIIDVKHEMTDEEGHRAADRLRRTIFNMYPNGIWERCERGHRILV